MKIIRTLAKVIFVLFLLSFIGLYFISRGNSFEPGLVGERLAACPDRPNCVTSFKKGEKVNYLEPISYLESQEPIEETLKNTFGSDVTIIKEAENYLHCSFKVGIWTDDVEFIFDKENKVIHFRSSSRWGYDDLGANKKRMEQIRNQVNARN